MQATTLFITALLFLAGTKVWGMNASAYAVAPAIASASASAISTAAATTATVTATVSATLAATAADAITTAPSFTIATPALAGTGTAKPASAPGLARYIEAARAYSPLAKDRLNQIAIDEAEAQRLRALYTRSRVEVNGDLLFVPIISADGGHTRFSPWGTSGTKTYGYDLGETSSFLHAGIQWSHPLLGRPACLWAEEQKALNQAVARNDIRLEDHQLIRAVTEQYVLCLLDRAQADYADSTDQVLARQSATVGRLQLHGLAHVSDLHLIEAERQANAEQRTAALQAYHTHLMELNLLCGLSDTADVSLPPADLALTPPRLAGATSGFSERYRLDSLQARSVLRGSALAYRPQLNVFVNSGFQTGAWQGWQRHFGWSAGLTFSWTLYDGHQQRYRQQQTERRLATIAAYSDREALQRQTRLNEYLAELHRFDERRAALDRQIAAYDATLANYQREIAAGLTSTLDYLTVLRSKIQAGRDRLLLMTNRQLAIAAYNYWNW